MSDWKRNHIIDGIDTVLKSYDDTTGTGLTATYNAIDNLIAPFFEDEHVVPEAKIDMQQYDFIQIMYLHDYFERRRKMFERMTPASLNLQQVFDMFASGRYVNPDPAKRTPDLDRKIANLINRR
jgi:hypothetical protein